MLLADVPEQLLGRLRAARQVNCPFGWVNLPIPASAEWVDCPTRRAPEET
jgi:hypothetical protein